MSNPKTLIEHARYPLAEPDSAMTTALIAQCRTDLAEQAVCVVDGFLTPESLAVLAAEAEGLAPEAHHRQSKRNCYIGVADDPALGLDHPRRHFMVTTLGVVADDFIPVGSGLRALYIWPAFQSFLAAIMGYPILYPNEDRFQALNVIVYGPGEQSDWHFDPDNDCTVTLLLQEAEQGGGFSIAPDIRSHHDENYPGVKQVLDGDKSGAAHLERPTGSLVVFRGHDSLHRVATIEGERLRLVCVMCYEDRPGIVGGPKINAAIYGPRAAAIEGLA